ncbi:hypothetical protein C8R43DRAFT_946239 [Mycena crocata]|nr:hypothetical protein C8R43DRAFT_946239 [Mycena crocata]
MTSTTSFSMPPTSSTASLIASGGDDLDDDDRLPSAPTLAASPSPSPTSSSKSVPSRGSLDLNLILAVLGSTDGLGAPSAWSAQFGARGADAARRNTSATRSLVATADFRSNGARNFLGFIRHPRPLFPTVELVPTRFPRPDRKCATSGYALPSFLSKGAPDTAYEPLITASPRLLRRTAYFGSSELYFFRLTGAHSGGSPTLPLENIPWRRFRFPWELYSAGLPDESLGCNAHLLVIIGWLHISLCLKILPKGLQCELGLQMARFYFAGFDLIFGLLQTTRFNSPNAFKYYKAFKNLRLLRTSHLDYLHSVGWILAIAHLTYRNRWRPELPSKCSDSPICLFKSRARTILISLPLELTRPPSMQTQGFCARKGRDYLQIENGPLIGLASLSTAGTITRKPWSYLSRIFGRTPSLLSNARHGQISMVEAIGVLSLFNTCIHRALNAEAMLVLSSMLQGHSVTSLLSAHRLRVLPETKDYGLKLSARSGISSRQDVKNYGGMS